MGPREEQGRREISAPPGPTPAAGRWPVILVPISTLWVLCFTAECFCVQFHSASDSQSSGVRLLVFSKAGVRKNMLKGESAPEDADRHGPKKHFLSVCCACFFFFLEEHKLTVFSLTVFSFLKS